MATPEEKFKGLLSDLDELSTYLHGRGEKTLAMSKQFEANAQKDASNRAFDLNQAKMLDYQHHTWHEIGNIIDKLIKQYQ